MVKLSSNLYARKSNMDYFSNEENIRINRFGYSWKTILNRNKILKWFQRI